MSRRSIQYFLILACAVAGAARAQNAGRTPAADSVFARARQLVTSGNGAAGRVLVDSMLTVAPPDSPAYAEALFWRGALAATAADSERDFRTVIVEYPLSPRTGDALLQLAQLEVARGDRASAATHLERFLLENPRSPERPRAALLLVRLSFEQNDPQTGCVFLARILGEVPESAVELRNQLEYYSPRCAAVDTTNVAGAATAKTDSARADSVAAAKAKGRYTLQVAAFRTKAEAQRLVKSLTSRGFDARVVGGGKVYRVRIGRFQTRAAAVAEQRKLKAKKINVLVTEVGPDDR